MLTQQYLFNFLIGQKRSLLHASADAQVPPILIEARGYAGGKKITEFLEAINKALHTGGYDLNNWVTVSDILGNDALDDSEKCRMLIDDVREHLTKVGLSTTQVDKLVEKLDQHA